MNVSAATGPSETYSSKEARDTERTILAMKKQRDAEQVQAEGMLQLIQQASPDGVGRLLSVYA